jgi:hypothetical protein
MGEARRQ